MKLKNRILIIYILVLTLATYIFSTTSFADNINNQTDDKNVLNLDLYSKSCILVECSTNKIVFEKNVDTVMYPASTTKILTAILAVENCNLADTVTITQDMINKVPSGYTTAYLQAGEQVTVEELLNLLLIPSANDAGFALAIHISGSVDEFVNLMNDKAKQIGCTNSNFTNPSGIHDNNHYSTAKDISLIGMYAIKNNPCISDICSKTSYVLHQGKYNERTFETTNTLMKQSENSYYEYATGLKTGFTTPAGSCIIATAQKDNMKFLVVVLGAPETENDTNYRDIDCKTLFEYGFQNFDNIIKFDAKFIDFFNGFFIPGIAFTTLAKAGLSVLILVFVSFFVFRRDRNF